MAKAKRRPVGPGEIEIGAVLDYIRRSVEPFSISFRTPHDGIMHHKPLARRRMKTVERAMAATKTKPAAQPGHVLRSAPDWLRQHKQPLYDIEGDKPFECRFFLIFYFNGLRVRHF